MTTAPAVSAAQRQPGLLGQTVVVIGGSSEIRTRRTLSELRGTVTPPPVRDNSNLSRTTGGTTFPGTEVPTMEFLVTMTTHVPDGTSGQALDDVRGREAARPRELAGQGHLLRLWVQPRQGRALGGEPETPPRCRRSSNRCRCTAG